MLFLGDSIAEYGDDLDDTFVAYLRTELNKNAALKRTEVINAGVLGYTNYQELLGLGHPGKSQWKISPDLSRYVQEIEREFDGLPTDPVLLDLGDWIYLRQNVLMKDRLPILVTPRDPRFGLMDRVRKQGYARILVHNMPVSRKSDFDAPAHAVPKGMHRQRPQDCRLLTLNLFHQLDCTPGLLDVYSLLWSDRRENGYEEITPTLPAIFGSGLEFGGNPDWLRRRFRDQ